MIKVLIDSSAWIHFLRQSSPGHHEVVATILREGRGSTCGLIITEVFRGVRSEKERSLLLGYFELLDYLDLKKEDYSEAAATAISLKQKGLTVKTIDLLVSHLAIKHDLTLLHDDSDFKLVARHLKLNEVNPR